MLFRALFPHKPLLLLLSLSFAVKILVVNLDARFRRERQPFKADIMCSLGILKSSRFTELSRLISSRGVRLREELYQDNDPKHTSRYVQGFFKDNDINWWKSPAESPDINCTFMASVDRRFLVKNFPL